ncbi:uncharacterized protein [Dendrobates tinctorius]|uniref:uncharacterized protein n=1 Tax=Dendrobates tinctorius TaxID=92724 RepID=UPI003CCA3CF8
MEKDGDLDTFLQAFEKACRQYQLPMEQWVRYLTPRLKGKALEAFASLPSQQDSNYVAIKQALIAKYRLTPEVYQKKFRNLQRGPHDSYSDVVQGLRTHFDQWIHGLSVDTFELLKDRMIKDYFFHLCPAEVRQFILDGEPMNADKAAQIDDHYEAKWKLETRKPVTASWRGGKPATNPGARASHPSGGPVAFANTRPTSDTCKCFVCNRTGHISATCPERQKNPPVKGSGPNTSVFLVVGRIDDNVEHVRVETSLARDLKDTGAERTLIRPGLAAPVEFTVGKTLTVTGIGGAHCPLPMAQVFLDWGAGSGVRELEMSDNLPIDVLLGTDLGRMVAYYIPDTPPQSDNKGNINPDDALMSNDATDNHSFPRNDADDDVNVPTEVNNHSFPRNDADDNVNVPTEPDNHFSEKVDVSTGTGVLSHVPLRSEMAEETLAGASVGATGNGEVHGTRKEGDAMPLTSATEEGNWPISSTAPEMLGVDGEVEPITPPAGGSVEIPGETAYVAAVTRSQSARNAGSALPFGPSSATGETG